MTDPPALEVLGDVVQEAGWFDPRVMPVMLGFPLDPERPYFQTKEQRLQWEEKRERGRAKANSAFYDFAAKPTFQWSKAVVAVLLFGGWMTKKKGVGWQQCPWPLVRKQWLDRKRELDRHHKEMMRLSTIAAVQDLSR